jgi:hypothetical protein
MSRHHLVNVSQFQILTQGEVHGGISMEMETKTISFHFPP